jgi:periplasmic mercuric ion binding protein
MKQIVFLILIVLAGSFTSQLSAQKKGRAVVCFESDMECVDCETTLIEYLRFEKGVKDLKIDHASNTILVEFDEKKNNEQGLAKAVEKKGYKADKISRERYDELLSEKLKHGHQHNGEVHRERN